VVDFAPGDEAETGKGGRGEGVMELEASDHEGHLDEDILQEGVSFAIAGVNRLTFTAASLVTKLA